MANRLVSNCYIIDSHQIATPLVYGVSAALCTTANVGKMKVIAVNFMANDTTGAIQIAVGNTANIILDYKFIDGGAGKFQRTQVDHFGYGVPFSSVFIPSITASTAVLILE
jgi:hypothetical protein